MPRRYTGNLTDLEQIGYGGALSAPEAPAEEPQTDSWLSQLLSGIGRGVKTELPLQAVQALQYPFNPGDTTYDALGALSQHLQDVGGPSPQSAWGQAGAMIPPSIIPSTLAGGATYALTRSPRLAMMAASALGPLPAALQQGQQTLEAGRAAGRPEDAIIPAARKTAAIEYGGEAIGTYALGKLFGLPGLVAGALSKTAADVPKPLLKEFALDLLKTAGVETGTEMGQAYGERAVEQGAGIPGADPWQAAKDVVAPTLAMTAALGPLGLLGHAMARRQQPETVAPEPPPPPVTPPAGAAPQPYEGKVADLTPFDDQPAPPPPGPPGSPATQAAYDQGLRDAAGQQNLRDAFEGTGQFTKPDLSTIPPPTPAPPLTPEQQAEADTTYRLHQEWAATRRANEPPADPNAPDQIRERLMAQPVLEQAQAAEAVDQARKGDRRRHIVPHPAGRGFALATAQEKAVLDQQPAPEPVTPPAPAPAPAPQPETPPTPGVDYGFEQRDITARLGKQEALTQEQAGKLAKRRVGTGNQRRYVVPHPSGNGFALATSKEQSLLQHFRSLPLMQVNTQQAPSLATTQGQMQVGKVKFDNANSESLGQVPDNANVNYKGFTAMMKPSKFLEMVPPIEEKKDDRFTDRAIQQGKSVASPFLQVDFSGQTPRVTGHDGRHRMRAIQAVNGDQPVPVHVFPTGGMRARHVTPQQIDQFRQSAYPQRMAHAAQPMAGPHFGEAFHQPGEAAQFQPQPPREPITTAQPEPERQETPAERAQRMAPALPRPQPVEPAVPSGVESGVAQAKVNHINDSLQNDDRLSPSYRNELRRNPYKLAEFDPATELALKTLSELFNKEIVVIDSTQRLAFFNGMIVPSMTDTIFVHKKSSTPVVTTVMHELVHTIRRRDAHIYDHLKAAVMDRSSPDQLQRYGEATRQIDVVPDADALLEEMIADTMAHFARDPAFWQDFKRRIEGAGIEQSRVKQFFDWVLKWLDHVISVLRNERKNQVDMSQFVNQVDQIRGLFAAAAGATAVREQQRQVQGRTQVRPTSAPGLTRFQVNQPAEAKPAEQVVAKAPTFYSALTKSIEELKQPKASPAQWLGMISNLTQKGVKQEELEWSGIKEWLKDQTAPVTKEQLLDYLNKNSLHVQEQVYGADPVTGKPAKVVWKASHGHLELGEFDDEQLAHNAVFEYAQGMLDANMDLKKFETTLPPRPGRYAAAARPLTATRYAWTFFGDIPESQSPDSFLGQEYRTKEEAEATREETLYERAADSASSDGEVLRRVEGGVKEPRYRDYTLPNTSDIEEKHVPGYREVLIKLPQEQLARRAATPTEPPPGSGRQALGGAPERLGGRAMHDFAEAMDIDLGNEDVRPEYVTVALLKYPKDNYISILQNSQYHVQASNYDQLFNDLQEAEDALARELGEGPYGVHQRGEVRPFTHAHWSGEENVVAHVRFNDRTDMQDKKVLFVEEVQSDWHQQGRERGYAGVPDAPVETTEALQAEYSAKMREWGFQHAGSSDEMAHDLRRGLVTAPGGNEAALAWLRQFDARWTAAEDAQHPRLRGKIPNAPFKQSWPLLIMKRMIRWAADHGYDRVAWTTGAQQGARWGDSDTRTKGMQEFYDKILPREVGKYVKKWGSEVKSEDLAPTLANDDGKAKLLGMFTRAQTRLHEGSQTYEAYDPQTGAMLPALDEGGYDTGDKMEGYNTLATLKRDIEAARFDLLHSRPKDQTADQYSKQWVLDVTPAMKEAVLKGQPLFRLNNTGPAALSVTDVASIPASLLDQTKTLSMGLLGRRQLVDLNKDVVPELERYSDLMQQMGAERNQQMTKADDLVERWRDVKDQHPLAALMNDATLHQTDPDQPMAKQGWADAATHADLKRRFNQLSPEAQAVYREARDSYRQQWDDIQQALQDRIDRAGINDKEKRELRLQLDKQYQKAMKGVYFPLSRFGDYYVTVRSGDDETVYREHAPTRPAADHLRAQLLKEYPATEGNVVSQVSLNKDYSPTQDGVSGRFVQQLHSVIDGSVQGEAAAALKDAVNQLYLRSAPDNAWAKRLVHRKGTPGYSVEARRAYAFHMINGARQLARIKYLDQVQDSLATAQRQVDEGREQTPNYDAVRAQRVLNEMGRRHRLATGLDVSPLSSLLTGLGFFWHLGLSPAAAAVNLMQTPMVAYPLLGARYGFGAAAKELGAAMALSAQGKNDLSKVLNGDELKAYQQAVQDGVIETTQARDLSSVASGADTGYLAGVKETIKPIARLSAYMFHHAERFNRQAAMLAAYRLARQRGRDHATAYRESVKAVYDSHFDYAESNRPRLFQGNLARVFLLFKQYAQNMVYTLGKALIKGKGGYAMLDPNATPEEKEAAKQLAGLLAMHATFAGALGLPVATTLLAAASAIGGSADDPWDAKVALQNYLAEALGPGAAEVLMHGVPRAVFPADIASRVGLDGLIMKDGPEGLDGVDWFRQFATSLLGPVVGIGEGFARGSKLISEGHWERGAEAMTPKVVRDPMKAWRYASEGVKDKAGTEVVKDTTAFEEALQLMGFSPARASQAYAGVSAVKGAKRALDQRRQQLLDQYAAAYNSGDDAQVDKVTDQIDTFNDKQPAFGISARTLHQSLKKREERLGEAERGVYLPPNESDLRELSDFAAPAYDELDSDLQDMDQSAAADYFNSRDMPSAADLFSSVSAKDLR